MSDFDKEAEREKLRRQFAEDERERESTERMSELLLQGATMTNKHCDVHGDPLFRHDGEEFCPTCRTEGRETGPAEGDSDTAAGPAANERGPDGVDAADAPGTPAEAVETVDAVDADTADGEPADASDRGESSTATAPTAAEDGRETPPTPSVEGAGRRESAPRDDADASGHADLSAARASLGRTVTRFADAAERTDDLARAREYLAAVEDAADALAAVRDAER